MPPSEMLTSKIAYSAQNSAGRIYPSLDPMPVKEGHLLTLLWSG